MGEAPFALAGQVRAPAGRGAAHRADTVRREEPGADRAAAAGPGEIGVAEYLVELPPREMLEAKLYEAIRLEGILAISATFCP